MTLSTALSDPTRRQVVVSDAIAELEAELGQRSGLTNLAVKTGYKAVQKVRPGIIPQTLEELMGKFAPVLDGHFAAAGAAGAAGASVEQHFVANGPTIANDLLTVTDARVGASGNKVARSIYEKLRPKATNQVVDGMPRLARLVAKHS